MNREAISPGRLLVERQSPALKERLWQLVREAKGDDILAPVTVIGPTRYANLNLRQELGRGGFANVRFIVLPVLSEMLGAAVMARTGRKPLTPVLEGVYIREVLTGATGSLAPVKDHPSTLASVRSSFRELRNADDEVLTRLEAQGGVRGELVRLYRDFRSRTSAVHYDAQDLAGAAAEAVRSGDTPGLDDLGLIVLYLPRETSPTEAALIEALAQQGRCAVILGTTGDKLADEQTLKLSRRLTPLLGKPEAEPSDADENADDSPLLPGGSRLHIAPNAHEELRRVIRQIVEEAGRNRTPFHRMAVLHRTENPYGSLIRDELRLAGIPVAGPGRDTLASTAVGRTLTGLLRLPERDFQRADVMAWLTGCPVRPAAGRTPGLYPSRWDSLTRKAGIVGGLEQWRDRLGRHAKQLREDAERWEQAEEISEGRASLMRAEAAHSLNALSFLEKLAEDLKPPRGNSWSEFSRWASQLLEIYLDPAIPEDETVARDQVTRMLQELAAADAVNPVTTLEVFRQTVEESLRASTGHLGVTGQGVFVSNFSSATAMSFDALWLVGMIEGTTPPNVRPDPLLPEAGWRAAGGEPRREERVAAERYDYLSAVATAPQRVLSYPSADASSQREAFPSRWFLEQASALEGTQVHTGDLASLRGRPWLTVDDSGVQALSETDDAALADLYDYNRRRLLQWTAEGVGLGGHPFAQEGMLANSVLLGQRRSLGRLTEYDGNLTSVAENARFAQNLGKAPVSATSLESWATCPYRYFLGQVLRLSSLESPEEITTISALERGIVVHEILERFIRESSAAHELPPAGQAWSAESYIRLDRIAEEEFRNAESRGVTGKRLLWELTKQAVRDDLETFIEQDEGLRAAHGSSRIEVEARFGYGEESPALQLPGRQVSFRGRIDRIDLNADGSSALVFDYKTGSANPYRNLSDDPIDRGKRLQLGVYSLAVGQLFPEVTAVKAAYWFTSTGVEPSFAPPGFFDYGDAQGSDRFQSGVSSIMNGIESGVFPANPGPVTSRPDRSGPENCLYCDFNSLCPSRRTDLWERKKSDNLLSGYLALSEEPLEESK